MPETLLRLRPTWVEYDADALAHNVRSLKQMIGPQVELMAVVKADGYGHGALRVAQTALAHGATQLAVANLEEALLLRAGGIQAPLLILSYVTPEALPQALSADVMLTVYDLELADAYQRAAQASGQRLPVHLKIDSGMGRLGLLPDCVPQWIQRIKTWSHLQVIGFYTHFSMADESSDYTREQLQAFRAALEIIRPELPELRWVHSANSAATLAYPDTHFDLVRVGLAMYGLSPSPEVPVPAHFRPALHWKTLIASVKTLPAGHPVGYGNTYITQREEQIAVIPVGYADGLRRAPSHFGEVLVRGQRAPIVGRVSMEKTMLNVSHLPDVQVGDEVVLLGTQGCERITAEAIAARLGTINYEVVCSILPRVPR